MAAVDLEVAVRQIGDPSSYAGDGVDKEELVECNGDEFEQQRFLPVVEGGTQFVNERIEAPDDCNVEEGRLVVDVIRTRKTAVLRE